MSYYTTGEVAELCGVSVRTVQYYDARRVLVPSGQSEGGRRMYSEEDVSKLKVICFLRDLSLPLDVIAKIMQEENAAKVIDLIFEEQESRLQEEFTQKQKQLENIRSLRRYLGKEKEGDVSFKSIKDIAHVMKQKNKLNKMRWMMILTGLPVTALEITSIVLWATNGLWWLFLIWVAVAIPWGIIVSRYYFKSVDYICPECHEVFKPTFKQAFWASHTPTTRKLTCPKCGKKSYCVETYSEKKKNG